MSDPISHYNRHPINGMASFQLPPFAELADMLPPLNPSIINSSLERVEGDWKMNSNATPKDKQLFLQFNEIALIANDPLDKAALLKVILNEKPDDADLELLVRTHYVGTLVHMKLAREALLELTRNPVSTNNIYLKFMYYVALSAVHRAIKDLVGASLYQGIASTVFPVCPSDPQFKEYYEKLQTPKANSSLRRIEENAANILNLIRHS